MKPLSRDRIDAPPGSPAIVRNDLNGVQSLHRTCRLVGLAKLRLIDRLANLKTNGLRKLAKPFPGVAHPSDRLSFHPFQYISMLIQRGGCPEVRTVDFITNFDFRWNAEGIAQLKLG